MTTSDRNISTGSPTPNQPPSQPDASSFAIAELEGELAKARDARLQERFGWILAAMVVFDVWAFSGMETWSAPLAILIVQLFLIIVIARACGIEDIVELVSSIVKSIGDGARKS